MNILFFKEFIGEFIIYEDFPSHLRNWKIVEVDDKHISLQSSNHFLKFSQRDELELNILKDKLINKI